MNTKQKEHESLHIIQEKLLASVCAMIGKSRVIYIYLILNEAETHG
jgi:hypothetical protein